MFRLVANDKLQPQRNAVSLRIYNSQGRHRWPMVYLHFRRRKFGAAVWMSTRSILWSRHHALKLVTMQ